MISGFFLFSLLTAANSKGGSCFLIISSSEISRGTFRIIPCIETLKVGVYATRFFILRTGLLMRELAESRNFN